MFAYAFKGFPVPPGLPEKKGTKHLASARGQFFFGGSFFLGGQWPEDYHRTKLKESDKNMGNIL